MRRRPGHRMGPVVLGLLLLSGCSSPRKPPDIGARDVNADGVVRIVCLGDSNTDPGVPTVDYLSWCEVLQRWCPQWDIVNKRPIAMGQATALPPREGRWWHARQQTQQALDLDPDVMVYAYGTNDILQGRSTEDVVAEYLRIRDHLSDSRLMYVASVPHVNDPNLTAENRRIDELNLALRRAFPVVIDFTTGVTPDLYADRLHFRSEGCTLRAERALAVLDPGRQCTQRVLGSEAGPSDAHPSYSHR